MKEIEFALGALPLLVLERSVIVSQPTFDSVPLLKEGYHSTQVTLIRGLYAVNNLTDASDRI
jgi:hypothetical protein